MMWRKIKQGGRGELSMQGRDEEFKLPFCYIIIDNKIVNTQNILM